MDRWKKRPSRQPLVLLALGLATAYFAYHAAFGSHGLQSKYRLIQKLDDLQREIAVLEAVRSRLRQDVDALATSPPHPDLVEETARATFGWIRPGDLVLDRTRPRNP